MRRALSVGLAIVVAIVIAYFVLREDASFGDSAAPIEKLVAAGRIAEARAELDALRPHADPAVADYLDGLLLVAEQKDADAIEKLSKAHAAKPLEWRATKWFAAALSNAGRLSDAGSVLEDYVSRAPNDERGLAALAEHLVNRRNPGFDPGRALAAIERIGQLPERVAGDGDTTRISDADLARTKTKALLLSKQSAAALLDARAFVQRYPDDAEGWYLLGDVARLQPSPRADEALLGYRHAAQLVPSNRKYLEQFAMALLELEGSGQEAVDVTDALVLQWPGDAALEVLHARALVRVDQTDAAHAEYRELQKRADTLPLPIRLSVLRNLSVLLADWSAGGMKGDYFDEAWNLLQEYRRLGGEIDEDLKSTWKQLEDEHAKKGKASDPALPEKR